MSVIDADMRAVIQAAHLWFAATVTPDGKPNLSPKGTIRVWDDDHLFFLDIASPGTRVNLAGNPLDGDQRRLPALTTRLQIPLGGRNCTAMTTSFAKRPGASSARNARSTQSKQSCYSRSSERNR